MTYKKFRSRTGNDVRVALTTGHVAIVGSEWRDLAENFHSAAYSAGCISEDMVVNESLKEKQAEGTLDKLEEAAKFEAEVRFAIEKAIKDNNLDAFTKNNGPKAGFLKEVLGKPVPSHIRSKVWEDMLEEGMEAPGAGNDEDELKNDIT